MSKISKILAMATMFGMMSDVNMGNVNTGTTIRKKIKSSRGLPLTKKQRKLRVKNKIARKSRQINRN